MAMDSVTLTVEEILKNSIGFYVVSVVIFALRLPRAGIVWASKRVRWHDLLMIFTFVIYTILLGLINASVHFNTNLFPAGQQASIVSNKSAVGNRVTGSILIVSVEQALLLVLWGIKGCFLGFIYPLMDEIPKGYATLLVIAGFTITCLGGLEITFFGVLCTPVQEYWAVPVNNAQCASYQTYSKVQMAINLSTWLLIMMVSTAMTTYLPLPLDRKMIIGGLVSMGVMIIMAGGASKWYRITSPEDPVYLLWYIVETSLAMWVANAMCCWPLIRKLTRGGPFAQSFFVIRPSSPRDNRQPVRSRGIPLWSSLVATLWPRRAGHAVEEGIEMTNRIGNTRSAARQAASLSMDTTVMMHAELAEYLANDTPTPHSQSLRRDNDTSPALTYREFHSID